MSLAQKLALGFAIGPVVLVIIGWAAYYNTNQMNDGQALYTHTVEVLRQTQTLQAVLVDAETGQRGFLLTGDEAYLEPYRNALGRVDQAIASLAALTADNPNQQARLQTIRGLVRQRLDRLAQTIQARRDRGLDGAVAAVKSGEGKDIMDDVRDVLQQMGDEESRLLQTRKAASDSAVSMTFDIIIYGTLIAFVLLIIAGTFATRSITGPLRKAIGALGASTAEILAGTTQQASGIQEQAASVAETVSTVDEITQTSEQANERAKTVSDASRRAVEVGSAGRKAVEDTVSVMSVVKEQTTSIANSILGLAEQAQAIGEIIAAVNEIAEQTHLLALNAAIEASRAGEHGRGFNVVATEIRALADQSKKATAQVRQILGEVQKSTNRAVMATEEGTKSVSEAMQSVTQAGDTIRTLSETIAQAAQAAAQITASVGQQTVGMAQIQQAMRAINEATNQNLASTRQAEQAARDMNNLGAELQTLLSGSAA